MTGEKGEEIVKIPVRGRVVQLSDKSKEQMINAGMIEIEKTDVDPRMVITKAQGNMVGGMTGPERVTDTETEEAIDNEMVINREVVEAAIHHVEEPATDETKGVIHPETDRLIDPKIKEAMDEAIHQGMVIDPTIGLETGGATDRGAITTIDHETGGIPKVPVGNQTETMGGVSPGSTSVEIAPEMIRVKTNVVTARVIKGVGVAVSPRVGHQTVLSRLD